jgi:hypothetical protein
MQVIYGEQFHTVIAASNNNTLYFSDKDDAVILTMQYNEDAKQNLLSFLKNFLKTKIASIHHFNFDFDMMQISNNISLKYMNMNFICDLYSIVGFIQKIELFYSISDEYILNFHDIALTLSNREMQNVINMIEGG